MSLALGLIFLIAIWMLLGWINVFLTEIVAINQALSLVVVGAVIIAFTFIPMLILVSLAAECMWRIFFVYRILNVNGQPIREGWAKILKSGK